MLFDILNQLNKSDVTFLDLAKRHGLHCIYRIKSSVESILSQKICKGMFLPE